jgi:hypothetical protein
MQVTFGLFLTAQSGQDGMDGGYKTDAVAIGNKVVPDDKTGKLQVSAVGLPHTVRIPSVRTESVASGWFPAPITEAGDTTRTDTVHCYIISSQDRSPGPTLRLVNDSVQHDNNSLFDARASRNAVILLQSHQTDRQSDFNFNCLFLINSPTPSNHWRSRPTPR